ncbi:glycine--tRNA ligase [Micromonospora sp. URMC 107]|uniref:glycine--tRNA ligase n=1 Tax=Micromonospora sp. URMC 107 TaxID=3423418 RepID=UPI003F1C0D50
MQDALARLDEYWIGQGCLTVQPMNTEVGAGTLNPATFLRVLGPEPWRVAYVEPSVRPDDARYGENPNRIQCHTQYQVIIKPEPGNAQELYLGSLAALGIDVHEHDVRFVEDNWASPALGAWGLGWEVWLDGLEITQFTYFQQAGGVNLKPVSVEITYGIERILMALQGVRHFKEIRYAPGVTYGEVFGQAEYEMSRYALDDADVESTRRMLDLFAAEAQRMIDLRLPIPAHTFVLKCSHAFNVLDARGAISTAERTAEFARMRKMSAAVAELWVERRAELEHPLGVASAAAPAAAPALTPAAGSGTRRLVLEVGVEEMPPSEARSAVAQLRTLVTEALATTRLEHGVVAVDATPRRLVAVVDDVAAREADHERIVRGPRLTAAFGADGAPTPAALGFARSQKTDVDALERVDVDGVTYLAVVRKEQGRDVLTALSGALATAVGTLRSAKNMRWSDPQLSFTRPIRWIAALWGDEVVPFAVGALAAGRTTRVLRGSAQPQFDVASAEEFTDTLAAAGIVLSTQARRETIVEGAVKLAASVGGHVDVDGEAALLDQIAYLVEAPTPVLGSFEVDYLRVPHAILTTVMRKHQRYLPVRDQDGGLQPYFVTIANGAIDEDVVRAGNEGVLRARFEDASFFFVADSEVAPEQMRTRLTTLTFADKLGSMHDRAERISAIAARLADAVDLDAADRAVLDQARELVKFDLGSQMVTELTSLAGVMAREYALGAGKPEPVAQALLEVELPRSAGDALPGTPAGAILSLADRLDYLCGLAATVGLPTGSSDQYALRRAALGLQAVHRAAAVLFPLSLVDGLRIAAAEQPVDVPDAVLDGIGEFLGRRLEQALSEEGVPVDRARAVMLHSDRPALVDALLRRLQQLEDDEDFRRLVETMQRIRRIVPAGTAPTYAAEVLREPAELRLHGALQAVAGSLGDVTDLAAFARDTRELNAAVTAFFEDVFVMAHEPEVRAARLGLLAAVADLGTPALHWEHLRGA